MNCFIWVYVIFAGLAVVGFIVGGFVFEWRVMMEPEERAYTKRVVRTSLYYLFVSSPVLSLLSLWWI